MSDRNIKIVTTDIPLGDPGRGVFAYRVGDRVSAEDVKRNGWELYVSGSTTQDAAHAVASATGKEN